MFRSGSTWSFNVCRELYQLLPQQFNEPVKSGYLEAVQLEHLVTQKWPTMTAPTVIKAHYIGPAAMAALRAGTAKGICTYRDPRDCVASDMAFMSYPLEVCLKRFGGTLEPLRLYQTTPNILLVKYEDMMVDRPRQLRRIANHLGVPANDAALHQIDARTNLQACKELCAQLPKRPANQVLHQANHIIDPVTHLHQNHINGGTIGRWRSELSIEQAMYVTEFFAPWLLKLGYETSDSIENFMRNATAQMRPPVPMSASGFAAAFAHV
jgi:hypothetical protein